jgi:hypothetical protein
MSWVDEDAGYLLDYDRRGNPYVLDHPVSHIEPAESATDEIRQAHVKAVCLVNMAFSELQNVLEGPGASVNRALIRLYAIGYALGCNFVGGASLTQTAQRFSCSKAVLSRHATGFCAAAGVPASHYLKRAETRKTYAQRRREVIAQNGAAHA